MDTYNIYMDETPVSAEMDGEASVEVEFRVVPGNADDGDPENAVLAGLDLLDLINLRDSIQVEIDNVALAAFEQELTEEDGAADEELMP